MATLTVTANTDYRPAPAETNITDIVFAGFGGRIQANFDAAQFGPGLISQTVHIDGDSGSNVAVVYLDASSPAFSAAGWTFTDWNSTDEILIVATSANDTIAGSSQADFIAVNGAGNDSDSISTGEGDDEINLDVADVAAGTQIDGGGGADVMLLNRANTINLRQAAITGVERLVFGGVSQTAILNGDAFGPGGISEVNSISGANLVVRDDSVDLSAVAFPVWGVARTITLDGNSTIANALTGSSQPDSMNGRNASSDTMTGGGGADTLTGGNGNDFYVDPTGDTIVETATANSGIDTVLSGANFSLSLVANVEHLTLTGTGNTNATGNDLANALTGNGGNNQLSGGLGADTLTGGAGNDTYVDPLGDTIVEAAGQGTDTVSSNLAFSLELLPDIERLFLTGSAVINATGNALGNHINGNTAGNLLRGLAGADSLNGGDGNDTLDGGSEADTLTGGTGNDTYLNPAGDAVTEAANQGTDTVESNVAFSLELIANVERLFLTGAANINGNGNTLGNHINGNAANNTLRGYDGADSLNGGDGADTLEGGAGNDTMGGGNGADVIRVASANAGADTVTGFATAADRFDLSGGTFTGVSENAGSTTLTHTGGTILVQGVTGLTLLDWNSLHRAPFAPELSTALLPSTDYLSG